MSQGKIEWPPVVGMLPLEELHPKRQTDPDLPLEVLLWLLVLFGLWKLGDIIVWGLRHIWLLAF